MLQNHVMYSFVNQNYKFTGRDKKECLEMLEKILKIAEFVRKNGFLAVDDKIETVENPYLKEALTHVLNNIEPGRIDDLLAKHIFFENHTSQEILELLIIKEGVSLVIQGSKTQDILLELNPFFGKEFENDTQKIFDNVHALGDKIDSI